MWNVYSASFNYSLNKEMHSSLLSVTKAKMWITTLTSDSVTFCQIYTIVTISNTHGVFYTYFLVWVHIIRGFTSLNTHSHTPLQAVTISGGDSPPGSGDKSEVILSILKHSFIPVRRTQSFTSPLEFWMNNEAEQLKALWPIYVRQHDIHIHMSSTFEPQSYFIKCAKFDYPHPY